jgi:DNA-binding NarL/FixJ family response regulator
VVTTKIVRVVIADDHAIVREGLRTLLESIPGFAVTAEAATGVEAVERTIATEADLVVMDLNMPEMNGIVATRKILESRPEVGVLVLTMFDDDESVFEALKAGALSYILKGCSRDDLERAVIGCAHGEAVFGPSVARRILSHFDQHQAAAHPFPSLTSRERQILDLIARGATTGAIAQRLDISTKTVRNHASNIFTKLHVSGRAEAIVRAHDEGLGRK